MPYQTIRYEVEKPLAYITLNRPHHHNAIAEPMPDEIQHAVGQACADKDVRVIILRGEGRSFCAGFDFSSDDDVSNEIYDEIKEGGGWDSGQDIINVTSPYTGPIPKFMSMWRSPKPVVSQIQGWCIGGGSDMALCADIVVAADDAQIGTPYSRVWGCYLSGMWIYRLGLTKVKEYALTGDPLTGKEAVEVGLINKSFPAEDLEEETKKLALRMANIPSSQLAAMKLVVNQAFDNMGLQTTQTMGSIMDGSMRNSKEGIEFLHTALNEGVNVAVANRDKPFGDYSQRPKNNR